ncbi:hypothetical protein AB0C77_06800 [Streptomyces sp. NPDC048629]|uniref:hypothetical protein n=1 Tax=Streptomyces sp. NPDC048629 TaxID=3154824 RepID=UPI00343E3201
MTSTVILTAVLAIGITALVRACRADARRITAYQHRVRTADQVMDDARRWRSARDLTACRAIWPDAPHFIPQQQRKETGQ